MKLNKEFSFSLGEVRGNERKLRMNAYVWVQNLLNADNIIAVYDYTGNADDDGYLTSAEGQAYVQQQLDPVHFLINTLPLLLIQIILVDRTIKLV